MMEWAASHREIQPKQGKAGKAGKAGNGAPWIEYQRRAIESSAAVAKRSRVRWPVRRQAIWSAGGCREAPQTQSLGIVGRHTTGRLVAPAVKPVRIGSGVAIEIPDSGPFACATAVPHPVSGRGDLSRVLPPMLLPSGNLRAGQGPAESAVGFVSDSPATSPGRVGGEWRWRAVGKAVRVKYDPDVRAKMETFRPLVQSSQRAVLASQPRSGYRTI